MNKKDVSCVKVMFGFRLDSLLQYSASYSQQNKSRKPSECVLWNPSCSFSFIIAPDLRLIFSLLPKIKVGLSNHQPVCVSPNNNFWIDKWISWNLVGRWCHWRLHRCCIFNLVASAIPKWRTFKLLRWVQRNVLTFESIAGRNLIWRWWFIALMMEAVRTSEKSVNFNVTTRSCIPEDFKLQ
jgi:hypothetical protein